MERNTSTARPGSALSSSMWGSPHRRLRVDYRIKIALEIAACISALLVFMGICRTIFTKQFPFVAKLDESTRHAYALLGLAAVALLAWAKLDLHIESIEVAGVKASVGQLQRQVQTLSEQMEVFFKSKVIEVFDKRNWERVRTVRKTSDGVELEVTLKQEPIPGSVEVYEGVLLMPETRYHIDGKTIRFPANSSGPEDGLTIKYYPRVTNPGRQ